MPASPNRPRASRITGNQVTTAREDEPPNPLLHWSVRIPIQLIGASVLIAYLYILGLHIHWGNADLVRGLLQGADMARGNLLLSHWYSGPDSYWTIDLPAFTSAIMMVGSKVALLHVVSAVFWASLITAGAFIAATGLHRLSKWVSITALFLILGLPNLELTRYLAPTMVHVGTIVFTLLAFIGLRRGQFGLGWAAATILFTAGALGDPLIVAFGLVPAILAGILISVKARRWNQGISTISAPLVALTLTYIVRTIAEQLGTYALVPGSSNLRPISTMIHNVPQAATTGVSLLGLGRSLSTSGVPQWLEISRMFGVAVVVLGLLFGTVQMLSGVGRIESQEVAHRIFWIDPAGSRLNDLLILGFFGSVASYVALSSDSGGARYLTSGIVFGSILGAMFIGRLFRLVNSRKVGRAFIGVGLLLTFGYGACIGDVMAQPVPTVAYAQLGRFLESHGLDRGLGDYWSSAPITVFTGGRVKVRQVAPSSAGSLTPYLNLSKSTWYEGRFQFLVCNLNQASGTSLYQASHFPFYRVAHTYAFGSFRIIVWKRPVSIATLEVK
jgi:hypothetical protein